ncbi:uncharacterized protein LOC100889675 [Strongylocentrotus purpuratus]|uniref:Uncharacterized protein n=1 Tax=Strongylocentrotus purpuratus TaxID=7668 RepID=A0A7M7LPA8_STRPU|nr:uncharacterized protein LOC100889675 [Strongylocentrotus purpuratus]|eukprot:XP_003726028.1 PREDICTED: uncharacterized protein LOC100889675 [Strongylocentrotus purpuratus]
MDVVPPLTLLVTTGYILLLFFNFQAGIGPDSDLSLGLFRNSLTNMSDNYPTPITPAGYTFAIWGLIYSWFASWLVYVITTLFRTNDKGPVYLNPPTTSPAFLIAVFLNLTLSVLWLFANDRTTFILSLAALAGMTTTLYIAISIATSRMYEYLFVFKEYGVFDLWANRVLVHNGLALYATWTTISTKVNLSTTLIYTFGVDEDTTTYISFAVLATQLVTYFLLDCFVYDRYFRYILIVYPAALWSLGGILVANVRDPTSPQAVIGSTLFAIVFVFFVIKTILVIIRNPVYVIAKQEKADGIAYSRMV